MQYTMYPERESTIDAPDEGVDIADVEVESRNAKYSLIKIYLDFSVVDHVSSSVFAAFWPGQETIKIVDDSDPDNEASLSLNFILVGIENRLFVSKGNLGPYLGLSGYARVSASGISYHGVEAFTNQAKLLLEQLLKESQVGAMISAGIRLPLLGKGLLLDFECGYDPFRERGVVSAGLCAGFGEKRYD